MCFSTLFAFMEHIISSISSPTVYYLSLVFFLVLTKGQGQGVSFHCSITVIKGRTNKHDLQPMKSIT